MFIVISLHIIQKCLINISVKQRERMCLCIHGRVCINKEYEDRIITLKTNRQKIAIYLRNIFITCTPIFNAVYIQ